LQKSDSVSGGTPALEKALAGEELSYDDGVQLMNEENLFLLGAAADKIRSRLLLPPWRRGEDGGSADGGCSPSAAVAGATPSAVSASL
jgi:hypothetical protein